MLFRSFAPRRDHVGDGIAPRTADADPRDSRLQFIDLRRANIDAHPIFSLQRRTLAACLTLRPRRTVVLPPGFLSLHCTIVMRESPKKLTFHVSCDQKLLFNAATRSEEHTSELQSLMRISYAVFCLKKKNKRSNLRTNKPS